MAFNVGSPSLVYRDINTDCLSAGDFELMATSIGHQYVAIQYDRVLPEEEWRIGGPSVGEEAKKVS